MSVNYDLLLI